MTDQIQGKLNAHIDYTRAVLRERDQWHADWKMCAAKNRELLEENAKLSSLWSQMKAERDQLRKELAELRLQVISDIGQEIDAEPKQWMDCTALAKAIHYPDCWDIGAYPELDDALNELQAWFKCSNADCTRASLRHHDKSEPKAETVAWLQRRSIDSFASDGYETCEPSDYGAFPVYAAPQDGLRKAARMALENLDAGYVVAPDSKIHKALRKELGQE